MNRAIYIIAIPALLVATGYAIVLHSMGFAPGYSRFVIAAALFFGTIYWLSKKGAQRKESTNRS